MKKTIITSFLAIILLGSPAFAAETAPVVTDKADIATTPKDIKIETAEAKKKRIEQDLRSTVSKLQSVVDRTQVLIDLLIKNNRDTTEASKYIVEARFSLQTATDAIDQFSGVVPEVKIEKTLIKKEVVVAPAPFKEPLKKAEDSLKESKASLIQSITALKESLITKETN
ncbi:MAG: hypothetical protein KBC11_01970 [Candidatus Pacebacteria bacterium]|nr:hypothetical protein [Candidatus Paceibacterota bacterium]